VKRLDPVEYFGKAGEQTVIFLGGGTNNVNRTASSSHGEKMITITGRHAFE
jgi:hypothetical protein